MIKIQSRASLITWLIQIIDNELDRPDEQIDADLIAECSDFLDELQKEKAAFTERDIQQKIDVMRTEAHAAAAGAKTAALPRAPRRIPLYKKILVAVAAALLIAASVLVAAAHFRNSDPIWDFIEKHISQINRMSPGDTLEEGDITVTKTKRSTAYDSISDLLTSENVNILYPTVLPNDEAVTIRANKHENGELYIYMSTTPPHWQFLLVNRCTTDYSHYTTAEIYSFKGIDFYIVQRQEDMCQASCQYNGYEYTLVGDTRDSVIEIINSIEEYTPR